jgi:hypothetical protein
MFDFGQALQFLLQGKRLARAGWDGKGVYIEVEFPTNNSKMSLPYIFMKTADNNLVPWLASQSDLLTSDWQVVPPLFD